MLKGTAATYREAARRLLRADPNLRQAVKARAAVAAQGAPKTNQQAGAARLEQMGKAFGVDLGGVLLRK